jgi:cytidylate kinase
MADKLFDMLPSRIEQRIEAQVNEMAQRKAKGLAAAGRTIPFLTLSRQYGCEAMALAEQLAPRLASAEGLTSGQWQIFNRQILETLSRHDHLSERLLEALDIHSRGGIEEFFDSLIGQAPSDIHVLKLMVRTERALAMLGHCIIIGRGGVLLTAGLKGGIHVRLTAPEEWRRKNLITMFGWDAQRARMVLHEEENAKHSFFYKYLGQDVNNPLLYDLTINTAQTSCDEQAAAIIGLFKERFHLNLKL